MDSTHWKTELFPVADRIEDLATFRRYSDRRANLLEREVMLAMFSIRVLIERHKLSEEILSEKVTVRAYPKKTNKPTTWLNNHKINELFDLNADILKLLGLAFFCNQIIHSYIMSPVREGRKFTHLFVCSDYERNKFLYLVETDVIVALLRKVGFNSSSHMHLEFDPDPKKLDYKIRNYNVAEQAAPYNGDKPSN